jgi:hypothetical protein
MIEILPVAIGVAFSCLYGEIVMDRFAVAFSTGLLESVTCTVKWDVPVLVGVPEITPLALSERPLGNEPRMIENV